MTGSSHLQTKPPYCAKFFLFLWPLFAWSVGTAEVVSSTDDYVVQTWDADSGLPQSTVQSIVQTPDGYLWIGTLFGGTGALRRLAFCELSSGQYARTQVY